MANASTNQGVSVPSAPTAAPAVNGATAPDATDKPKRERVKREIPLIGCLPTKEEFAEIQAAAAALSAKVAGEGVHIKLPLGTFVLAHALKSIRAQNVKK